MAEAEGDDLDTARLSTVEPTKESPRSCVILSPDRALSLLTSNEGWVINYLGNEIEEWYLGGEHPNVTIIIPTSDYESIEYPFNMKTRKIGEGKLIERKSFKKKLMEIYGSKRKAIMIAILGALAAAAVGVGQCHVSKADSEGTDRIEGLNHDENGDKEKDGFC